jgi:hypothetical protein
VLINSWEVLKFDGQKLNLKLNISNPLEVSQIKRDHLIVQITKPSLFKTQEGGHKLADKSKIMKAGI